MKGIQVLIAAAAAIGLASSAYAADLPLKAPRPLPAPAYNWSGFYGGVYGGGSTGTGHDLSLSGPADPAAGVTTFNTPSGTAVASQTYNNLANGGVGQVTNAIAAGGLNCLGLTNCNVGGLVNTSIVANNNPGYRTDALLPASLGSTSNAGLLGLELGYRGQFNQMVLGIGADISFFSRGGSTSYNSQGSFYNSNGFTANSAATGCITTNGAGVCTQAAPLNTSGSTITVNSGGSSLNLAINANPNWVGTVRGSVGYAFDRLMIFGSAGLAYSDGAMSASGSYRSNETSACSGVSNFQAAAGNNAGQPGQSFVNYSCNSTAANSASVSRTTVDSVTYSGNHGGGMLTGFAAGGGAAYALSDHVSLLFEGFYYNLGTERATLTGSGTATTTTTTIPIALNGAAITPVVQTAAGALTASSFTVSKMIDGVVLKGGVQFKF